MELQYEAAQLCNRHSLFQNILMLQVFLLTGNKEEDYGEKRGIKKKKKKQIRTLTRPLGTTCFGQFKLLL